MYTNNNGFEVITHNAWWLQDVWCTITTTGTGLCPQIQVVVDFNFLLTMHYLLQEHI